MFNSVKSVICIFSLCFVSSFAEADSETGITNLAHTPSARQTSCQRLNRARSARVFSKSTTQALPLIQQVESFEISGTISKELRERGSLTAQNENLFIQHLDVSNQIKNNANEFQIKTLEICESTIERLGVDQNHGICSSTLIGPDLVLTSSHCLNTTESGIDACNDLSFNFNHFDSANPSNVKSVGCSQILYASNSTEGGSDFAIIRLDSRPLTGDLGYAEVSREGIKITSDLNDAMNEEIEIIGYPFGGDLISSHLESISRYIPVQDGTQVVLHGFNIGGMSGGGAYNRNCELTGIDSFFVSTSDNAPLIGFSSPDGKGCMRESSIGVGITSSDIISKVLDQINSGKLIVVDDNLPVNDPRRYNIGGPPAGSVHDLRRNPRNVISDSYESDSVE